MDAPLAPERYGAAGFGDRRRAAGNCRRSRLPGPAPRRRHQLSNPEPTHEPGVAEEATVTNRLESAPGRAAGATERKGVSLVSPGEDPVRDAGVEEQRWLGPEIRRLQGRQFPNGRRSANPRPTA